MMRVKLWSFDTVKLDFEDLDAIVTPVYGPTGTEVKITFRLTEHQISGNFKKMRTRLEVTATDKIMDLCSFLENPD